MKHGRDPIEPDIIDISGFDCVVIGTGLGTQTNTGNNRGSGRAEGLQGEKRSSSRYLPENIAGGTLPILARTLEEKGMIVRGQFVLMPGDLRTGSR